MSLVESNFCSILQINEEMEKRKLQTKNEIMELIDSGKLDEAKLFINEYVKIEEQDAEIYSMKAVIALMEQKWDDAENILIEGIGIYNEYFDLLYNLAYTYQMKDDNLLSIKYYRKALLVVEDGELKKQINNCIEELNVGTRNNNDLKPLVSIVVLAYNHLEYTKLCVESIYQYTSHIDFELITVNNGSSDGTEEYFNSLPNKKKINLKDNVGPVNGFNVGMEAAEGKYTACVCNDFIFTPRWLDNLLICIESDDKIGFVSPGASNVSNLQQINGDYQNLVEMQRFAENYNQSDSSKWEERVRLLPCVLMVRTKLLEQIGYYDPRFYFGEFADDDISFRIRRAGYKLIYAKDTFTFHFGSVTTEKEQRENNSLAVSRGIFSDKHGIDSWDDATFDTNIIAVLECNEKQETVNILGINTRCGGTPLQYKNKLKEHGISDVTITNFTENKKYLVDLKTVSDMVVCGKLTDLRELFFGEKYDVVIIEEGLEEYDIHLVIDDLKMFLKKNGRLIFKIKNESFYLNMVNLLFGKMLLNKTDISNTYINDKKLITLLNEKDLQINNLIGCKKFIPEQDNLIIDQLAAVNVNQKDEAKNLLGIYEYLFVTSLA